MKLPTPVTIDPAAVDLAESIDALPNTSGVYRLSASGSQPHLSWSANLPRRLRRLLLTSRPDRDDFIARLRATYSSVDCWPTGSKLETFLVTYQLAKEHFPDDYLKRLRLRLPWFVVLTGSDPFPRLAVVNRPARTHQQVFGPFPSRDSAQRYEQEVSALFQLRRCTETLAPHPEHPGCIYGEMNQCLRPCQCVVTAEEYATEVNRMADFLSTNGKSSLAALSAARERASAEMDFEQAAQLHKRIEKISAAASLRGPVAAELDLLNGVALTRGIMSGEIRLWPMLEGYWQEAVPLTFSPETERFKSLDQELRERLSGAVQHARRDGPRIEELAIFSRWYFSSWRDGEWLPFRSVADLNYRKLVREISAMVKSRPAHPAAILPHSCRTG